VGGGEIAFEMIAGEVRVDEERAELPGLGNLVGFEPIGDGFFAVAAFELVFECGRLEFGADSASTLAISAVRFGEIRESVEFAGGARDIREGRRQRARLRGGC